MISTEAAREDWCICGEPQYLHESKTGYCRKIKEGSPCWCEVFISEVESAAKKQKREKMPLQPVPVKPEPVPQKTGLESWL